MDASQVDARELARTPQKESSNDARTTNVRPQEADPYALPRRRIDTLDRELLRLLNERARIGLEIGRLKRKRGQPVHVPQREGAILLRLARLNQGPLSAQALGAIFEMVFQQVRALEEGEDSE